jgi:hypothetical protein
MPDHEGLVAGVTSQITLLRDHHSSDLARHLNTLRHQADAARAELQRHNPALADKERRATLTLATNWRHLARAAVILTRHSDLESQGAFEQVALDLQPELGPDGRNPGITIWRGVQRLGKQLFQYDQTPESYLRFDGFQRLVFDLILGQ